ncbi:nucleoside deaminase [Acholeplasma equirhinis]|uniref:nucleoside deaminase n=1 Tax=Acholeplasma equirhinis TaxID=555393 RepID=UPI00197AA12B|nr:nucleoside deaminase [Acholeplasma equirhinis]MBN3490382.1 nucleoside deaminase [Acholeplasma equirhinis]
MNKFMRQAINEAKKGIDHVHGGPFGAVVVKDGVVIAKGHNTVLKDNDPTAHGEVNAIRKATKKLKSFDLTGCEIYTTGEPCPMCLGAILWANIDKVYFGANIDDTEKIGFRDSVFYEIANGKKEQILQELDRKAVLKLYQYYLDKEHRPNY